MAKFASAKKQAVSVVNQLKSASGQRSIRTDNHNIAALTRAAEFAKENQVTLRDLTVDQVKLHLAMRGELVVQNQLDVEARVLTNMLRLTGQLKADEPAIKAESDKESILRSRAYAPEQVSLVAARQQEQNRLATEIAHSAGLRAHELYTIRRLDERKPDARPAMDTKWRGREGAYYTVKGKGGLVRVVLFPHDLVEKLEARRLDEPVTVKDRDIYYKSYYDISAGKKWSQSFSAASKRALKWTEGAHGLRHSYAQERMKELKAEGIGRADRLRTVSQEMGHFRPDITLEYLR